MNSLRRWREFGAGCWILGLVAERTGVASEAIYSEKDRLWRSYIYLDTKPIEKLALTYEMVL